MYCVLYCVQVTADGSLNCADNPAEQEVMVAQLLYCEAVSALLLLRPGGSFVLKTFTTLESHTLCLMFLLACCFNEVCIKAIWRCFDKGHSEWINKGKGFQLGYTLRSQTFKVHFQHLMRINILSKGQKALSHCVHYSEVPLYVCLYSNTSFMCSSRWPARQATLSNTSSALGSRELLSSHKITSRNSALSTVRKEC